MKRLLVESFRMMDRAKSVVEDEHGNVSCRSGNDAFLIKPSGMRYDLIQEYDIPTIMFDGPVVGGKRPSVDTDQHRTIYEKNPWIGSICHTHSPYATACAIANIGLNICCTEHADYFGHSIECFNYDGFEWGKHIFPPFWRAVLLRGHGTLTFSPDRDPRTAVKLTIALEAICKKYTIALGLSPNGLTELPDAQQWNDRYQNDYGQR